MSLNHEPEPSRALETAWNEYVSSRPRNGLSLCKHREPSFAAGWHAAMRLCGAGDCHPHADHDGLDALAEELDRTAPLDGLGPMPFVRIDPGMAEVELELRRMEDNFREIAPAAAAALGRAEQRGERMMGKLLHRCILPFELTNGNDGRGRAWFRSDNIRKGFEKKLRLMGMIRSPFRVPVTIEVIRILGRRQSLWDSSSVLRGNYKELEDALVAVGWFHDDGPAFIREAVGRQDSTRRAEGPSIELIIRDATS